jgi:hypothetical protein
MSMNFAVHDWRARLKASGIHFLISLLISSTLAFFVFRFWYPHPLDVFSGGRFLFLLLIACDVVLGPLITLLIFNTKKPKSELKLDIAVVACIQLLALSYGVWSVFVARPVYIVFERDLYRIVRPVDIPVEKMASRPPEYASFPLAGPVLLSLREFRNTQEMMNTSSLEMGGLPMSAQPEFWEAYSKSRSRVLKSGKPVDNLLLKFPKDAPTIKEAVASSGVAPADLLYFSFVDRTNYWTVLVDKNTLALVAYLPLDSYE